MIIKSKGLDLARRLNQGICRETTQGDGWSLSVYSNKDTVSNNDSDLGEQINALQRALAAECGENHSFREEIGALIRQRLVNADD